MCNGQTSHLHTDDDDDDTQTLVQPSRERCFVFEDEEQLWHKAGGGQQRRRIEKKIRRDFTHSTKTEISSSSSSLYTQTHTHHAAATTTTTTSTQHSSFVRLYRILNGAAYSTQYSVCTLLCCYYIKCMLSAQRHIHIRFYEKICRTHEYTHTHVRINGIFVDDARAFSIDRSSVGRNSSLR